MPSTDRQRQLLAEDVHFQSRVRSAVSSVANDIFDESTATTHHAERLTYALLVIADLDAYGQQLARVIVERNVIATDNAIDYDFEIGAITSVAADTDLQTEFAGIWNDLAGVAS